MVRRSSFIRGAAAAAISLAITITGTPQASAAPLDIYNSATDPSPNFYLQFLENFTPQGIAYSGSKNLFYVTHYNHSDTAADSRIAIYDGAGNYKRYVRIASGHVGGVAVWKNWLYVVTSVDGMGRLRRYSLDAISDPTNATKYVAVLGVRDTFTGASSFASVSGGEIFFGTHSDDPNWSTKGKMWSWPLDPDNGVPSPTRTDSAYSLIPANVQGFVRTADYDIFSTSRDRDCRSRFIVIDRSSGKERRIYAPSMSEGIVNAGGSLFINFESASSQYAATALDVTERVAYGTTSTFGATVLSDGFAPSADDGCQG